MERVKGRGRWRGAEEGVWLQQASAAGLGGGTGLEGRGGRMSSLRLYPFIPSSPLLSSAAAAPLLSLCCLGRSGCCWALESAVSRHRWGCLVVWQCLLLQQLFPICGEGVVATSCQLDCAVVETDKLGLQNYWIVRTGRDLWKSSKDSSIW